MSQLEPYPEPDARYHARTLSDAIVAGIPYIGGPLNVILTRSLPDRLTKRRDAWFRDLNEVCEKLHQEIIESDKFTDAVYRATKIALDSYTEGRAEMLIAALKGFTHDQWKNDALNERMFTLIEALSPEHILALSEFLEKPRGQVVHKSAAFPLISHLRTIGWTHELTIDTVVRQLIEYNLVETDSLSASHAFGQDNEPDWYRQGTYVSLSAQYFLRYLEAFDDSKVRSKVTTAEQNE